MAAPAGGCRRRTGLIDPDGPEPYVHASRVDLAIVPARKDSCSRMRDAGARAMVEE
jgi:hypothetical protein